MRAPSSAFSCTRMHSIWKRSSANAASRVPRLMQPMLRLLPLNSEADLARELEVVGAEVVVAEVVGERAGRGRTSSRGCLGLREDWLHSGFAQIRELKRLYGGQGQEVGSVSRAVETTHSWSSVMKSRHFTLYHN